MSDDYRAQFAVVAERRDYWMARAQAAEAELAQAREIIKTLADRLDVYWQTRACREEPCVVCDASPDGRARKAARAFLGES